MLYACLGKSEPAQSGPDGTDGPEPRIVQDKSEVTVKAEDIRAATDKVTTEDRGGRKPKSLRRRQDKRLEQRGTSHFSDKTPIQETMEQEISDGDQAREIDVYTA